MLTLLVVLLIAIASMAAAWFIWQRRARGVRDDEDRTDTLITWPPTPTRVLNSHERAAFDTLRRAVPAHTIFAQLPVSRFLTVPKRDHYGDWLRRLGYQCVDFVVCDKSSQVVAVIELQPSTGPRNDRALRRTERLARTLEAAGIPLHVWVENSLPTLESVRDMIEPRTTPTSHAVTRPMIVNSPTSAASKQRPESFNLFANSQDDMDMSQVETTEMLDPPSTWFDDVDSSAAPLPKHG